MLALLVLAAAQPLPAQPPEAQLPGAAVDERLAARFDLAPGDTFRLTTGPGSPSTAFRLDAVYAPRPDPATALRGEYHVRLHLPDLAELLGYPDRVDRIAVATVPGVSADSAAFRIDQLAFGYRAYPSTEIASESSRTFAVVSRFHRAIGLISIVASATFLLCIMLLKVEERRLDAAVMRMIGIGRRTIFRAFLLEASLIATLGSIVGIGLAALASMLTNYGYRRRFETSLVFSYLTWDIVLVGVALSLGLGIVAGALAARRLLRARPLDLWRRAA